MVHRPGNRAHRDYDSGLALPIVLVLMLIALSLCGSFLGVTALRGRLTTSSRNAYQARILAEGGASLVKRAFVTDPSVAALATLATGTNLVSGSVEGARPSSAGDVTFALGTINSVTAIKDAGASSAQVALYDIRASATSGGVTKVVSLRLRVNTGVTGHPSLTVPPADYPFRTSGNQTGGGDLVMTGNMYVEGKIEVSNNGANRFKLNGNAYVTTTSEIGNKATIAGDFYVKGAASFKNNLDVEELTLPDNLKVGGNIYSDSGIDLGNNFTVKGSVYAKGRVDGKGTINKNLYAASHDSKVDVHGTTGAWQAPASPVPLPVNTIPRDLATYAGKTGWTVVTSQAALNAWLSARPTPNVYINFSPASVTGIVNGAVVVTDAVPTQLTLDSAKVTGWVISSNTVISGNTTLTAGTSFEVPGTGTPPTVEVDSWSD